MLVPASPTPPPTPSAASAYSLMPLQPRQTDFLGYDSGCFDYSNALRCTSILTPCYDGFLEATDYNAAATACYCSYGGPYLDCFFSQIATGTCAGYYGSGDYWNEYQTSFYYSYCGSVPPSAMEKLEAPTIKVVTATGGLNPPDYAGQPNYRGTGDLLKGPCTQTDFTLVDAGNTVYYAGFQGCNKDRPDCCPWAVATSTFTTDAQNNRLYDFPRPADGALAELASCADDYYSISGGCCPNGFWPFTREVGGITPCWSSIARTRAPELTLAKDAKTKEKPTSAVVNIVWSMRYPVAGTGGKGGLSTAAKAGIGAGVGVVVILIAGLAICLWMSRRKKKLAEAQPAPSPPYPQGSTFAPGMVAPGTMPTPPPDRNSMATTVSQLTPGALVPQHTGTSGTSPSELSSVSGQGLLSNVQPGGYLAAGATNPRVSYSSSGTGSPAVGANGQGGYPAPIAEADEGLPHYAYQQQQHHQQYAGYQHPQQYPQQHPQYPQQQQPAYGVPAQYPQQQQGNYSYPSQYPPSQQQQHYPANVPEMSTHREADPPQEMIGSHVPDGSKGQ
ncbi:hypothetical protein N0V88_003450 [Collariella sp. IMI 366227]|nr:hypothetical protein N0V88_003450 [Collariella sp. IMI 366227]